MALYVFSLKLDTAAFGMGSTDEPLDHLKHLLLPAIVLSFEPLAGITRYTRSSMMEVLNQDYVTTARAKGLPQRAVTLGHAFRNALCR